MSGTYETEPYRIIAAETLAYFNLRIQEVYKDQYPLIPILVMGDFNDEPGSRALTEYALSSCNKNVVLRARNPRLFNLMWPLTGYGYGTFWFDAPLFFDQFLVSKGFIHSKGIFEIVEDSVEVVHPAKIWETQKGDPKPRAFEWKPRSPLGYSDHFPIALKIKQNQE